VLPGYNFRLEGLQGAVLAVKLPHLDSWNDRRRAVAKRYGQLLAGQGIELPTEESHAHHVYHLYVIQTDDREGLRDFLAQRGIETGLHYPIPLHQQEAYASLGYRTGDFPVTEKATQRILSLPMYPDMPMEAVDYVSDAIIQWVKSRVAEPAASR
jgi:dTDP-4-amino-4,6-dideoxygalactose transaminase